MSFLETPTFSFSVSGKKLAAEACQQGPSPVSEQGETIEQISEQKSEWLEAKKKKIGKQNSKSTKFTYRGEPTDEEIEDHKKRYFQKREFLRSPCPCGGERPGCRGFIIFRDPMTNRAEEMPKDQEAYERWHLGELYQPPMHRPKGMAEYTYQNVLDKWSKRREKERIQDPNQRAIDMVSDFNDELRREFEREGKNPDCPENKKIIKKKVQLFKAKIFALAIRLDISSLWKGISVLERDVSQKQPEEFDSADCLEPWFEGCQEYRDSEGRTRFRPPFMIQGLDVYQYPIKPLVDPSSQARVECLKDKELYFMPYYSPFFRRDTSCCVLPDRDWKHPGELAWSVKAAENIRWMGTPRGNPPMDPSWRRVPWKAQMMRWLGFEKSHGRFVLNRELYYENREGDYFKYRKHVQDSNFDQKLVKESERVYKSLIEDSIPEEISTPSICNDGESEKEQEEVKSISQIDHSQEDLPVIESVLSENFEFAAQETESASQADVEESAPSVSEVLETVRRRKRKPRKKQKMTSETREAIQEEVKIIEQYLEQVDDFLKNSQTDDSDDNIPQMSELSSIELKVETQETPKVVIQKVETPRIFQKAEEKVKILKEEETEQLMIPSCAKAKVGMQVYPERIQYTTSQRQKVYQCELGPPSTSYQLRKEDLIYSDATFELTTEEQMWNELSKSQKKWNRDDWEMNLILFPGNQVMYHFFKVRGVAYRPPRFRDFHNDLDLYHFLRQHRTRRYYSRMTDWYYIPKKLVDIIFPGNMQANKGEKQSFNSQCIYQCKSYHQSCQWHDGYLDSTLAFQRTRLLKVLDFHRQSANFWISLVYQVNHPAFQADRRRFFYQPQAPDLPKGGAWQREELPNFEQDTEKRETYLCPCLQILRKEEYDAHILLCVEEPERIEQEVQEESDSSQENTSIIHRWKEYLLEQYRSQIDNLLQTLVVFYNWSSQKLYRYRRFLVNVTSALLNMLFFPKSVVLNIPIILNEILSEMPEVCESQVSKFCDSLKHVIKRVHNEDLPRVQAQTTREEDEIVANESFGKSFWEIIKSFLPTSRVEAGLLRARQLRIENSIKSLANIKQIHEFLFSWLQHIWILIQVYLFGATKEELEDAYGILSTDRVTNWVSKVDSFELEILANGRAISKSTSMMYDYQMQKEYQELRKEGLEIEKKLAHIKTPQIHQLQKMVMPRLKKIGDWLNCLKGNLTKIPPIVPPFVLYLVGPPKVGKTLCVDSLMRVLISCKYPEQPDYEAQFDRFQRSRTTAYFDGYNGQKVYVMDDVFQIKDNEILMQELGDIIDLSSPSKTHLNTAQLETKAGLYFTSDFIVLTSNVYPAEHELERSLAQVEALNRRIDCLLEVRQAHQPSVNGGFQTNIMRFRASQWKMSDGFTKGEFRAVTGWMDWDAMVSFLVGQLAEKDKQESRRGLPVVPPSGFLRAMRAKYQRIRGEGSDQVLDENFLPQVQSKFSLRPICEACGEDFSMHTEEEQFLDLYEHCLLKTRKNNDLATIINHKRYSNYIRANYRPQDLKIEPSSLDEGTVRDVQWLQSNETLDLEGSMWNYSDIFSSGNARLLSLFASEARIRADQWTWKNYLLWPKNKIQSYWKYYTGEALQTTQVMRNQMYTMSNAVSAAASEIKKLLEDIRSLVWISLVVVTTAKILRMAFDWIRGLFVPEIEGFGGSAASRTNARNKKIVRVEAEEILCNVCHEKGHSWKKHYCSLCDNSGHFEGNCPQQESFGGSASSRTNATRRRIARIEDGEDRICESFGGSSSSRTDAKRKKIVRVEAEARVDRELLVESLIDNLPPIEGARDINASTLIGVIRNNLVVIRNMDTFAAVRGFFLSGRIVMAPRHILLGATPQSAHLRISTNNVASYNFQLSEVPYYIDEGKDVLLFMLPSSFQGKLDMTRYFMKQEDASRTFTSGYIVTIGQNPSALATDLDRKSYWDIKPLEKVDYKSTSGDVFTVVGGLMYQCDSVEGDCGSLIVQFDPSAPRKLLGFHIAGKTGVGYASLITQEYLKEIQTKLPLPVIHSEVYYEEEFYPCLEDLDEYFDVQGVPMDILGRLPQNCVPHTSGESELMPSPIYGKLIEPQSRPALLKEIKTENGVLDPFQYGLKRLQHPQIIFPQEVVDIAVQGMIATYSGWNFNPTLYGNEGLLTESEMICGIEGHPWIRPLNMSTSPGYPFQLLGGKSNFIVDGVMTDLLRRAVETREIEAKQGRQKVAIIVDTLKDERLPHAKVDLGKTRIFSNCPLDMNLLFRKYFLKFLCFCMDNHIMGEVSVGLNVHSEEWELLFKRLQKSGAHWLGGDYAAWDKRTPLQIAIGSLDLVESFYRRFNDYHPSHALVRRVLVEQAFTGIHLLPKGKRNILYRVHQTMPSGIPLTAVYNSILNLCLLRVVYILLARENGMSLSGAINSFCHHVAVVAYGDDHIMRVSNVVFPWFNMLTIQKKMAEYGIGYTAPDKSSIMPKELEESKLTYLKRSFRIDAGRINAPLDIDHVIDILNWVRAKNDNESKEAFQSAVRSVYIELTHHDRATFNHWFVKILRASVEAGVIVDVVTYEDALRARLELKDDSSWATF